MSSYYLDHLQYLETEAIHVMREVAAEFERPALFFPAARTRSACFVSPKRPFVRRKSRCRFSIWTPGTTFPN